MIVSDFVAAKKHATRVHSTTAFLPLVLASLLFGLVFIGNSKETGHSLTHVSDTQIQH